ncbi:hypothetical protein AVEN_63147-1 [Araneus ventricosus]|uniref:Uncharacterized protein n=1 Tax=Araneus ventricosus TaxID=182803 RepID=A0A4Y2B1U2_ARAVE|nr:hypothetical protein AVEN_63147-1 [Araneus ventricosus]
MPYNTSCICEILHRHVYCQKCGSLIAMPHTVYNSALHKKEGRDGSNPCRRGASGPVECNCKRVTLSPFSLALKSPLVECQLDSVAVAQRNGPGTLLPAAKR